MLYSVVHSATALLYFIFFVLFLSGQTLMLYPLAFGALSALFQKTQSGKLGKFKFAAAPPATLHSLHTFAVGISDCRDIVSFPVLHLNILPSGPFMWCIMYNLW